MNSTRRWLFAFLALEGAGLVLGLLIPGGEATLHGILLSLAALLLLFPGSILAVMLNTHLLPQHILQSQREESNVNVLTAVVLNCVLLGVLSAVFRRRKP